jgi:hypothetical protein
MPHHFFIAAMHIAVGGIIEIDPEIKGSKQHGRIATIHHTHTHGCHLHSRLAEGSIFKVWHLFAPP